MPGCANVFALLFVLLGLASCATRPPPSESARLANWDKHLAAVRAIDHWACRGRIAMRLEREGFSASLHWRQKRDEYVLRLIAPLGRGSLELKGDQGGVSLKTADNKVLHAKDAEVLMQAHLGWHVPLAALGYWLRGAAHPDVPVDSFSLDEQGRLRELRQSGWQLNYNSYLDEGRYALPGRLSLQRGELRLRLAIRQWELP